MQISMEQQFWIKKKKKNNQQSWEKVWKVKVNVFGRFWDANFKGEGSAN